MSEIKLRDLSKGLLSQYVEFCECKTPDEVREALRVLINTATSVLAQVPNVAIVDSENKDAT